MCNLGFQTPHIGNGGNKTIASNGGLGGEGLGDLLVEKKAPYQNSDPKECTEEGTLHLNKLGLAIIPSEDGVGDEPMKVPKRGVAN